MMSHEAVRLLNEIDGKDYEMAHGEADRILLDTVAPIVKQAYLDLAARAREYKENNGV